LAAEEQPEIAIPQRTPSMRCTAQRMGLRLRV